MSASAEISSSSETCEIGRNHAWRASEIHARCCWDMLDMFVLCTRSRGLQGTQSRPASDA
eukprot:3355234-Pleurochrysis_carterae.AAC.2